MSERVRRRFLELARGFISTPVPAPVQPTLWRPPLVEVPRVIIPAVSPPAENRAQNAENLPPPVESRASPWFATRRALALPAGDPGAAPPPEEEPGPEHPRVSPWFR